jgi:hypothetical protein
MVWASEFRPAATAHTVKGGPQGERGLRLLHTLGFTFLKIFSGLRRACARWQKWGIAICNKILYPQHLQRGGLAVGQDDRGII